MEREKSLQKQDQYIVRMPDGMRDRLKSAAAQHMRSMNAEIISRIENHEALTASWQGLSAEVAERDRVIRKLEEQVELVQEQRDQAYETLHSEMEKLALLTHRRIPDGLYGRIQKAATKAQRTVEEEVLQALERAFPPPRPAHELREIADMIEGFLDKSGSTSAEKEELRKLALSLRQDADEQEAVAR